MKFISTLLLGLAFFLPTANLWKITGAYSFAVPMDEMASNIQPRAQLAGWLNVSTTQDETTVAGF